MDNNIENFLANHKQDILDCNLPEKVKDELIELLELYQEDEVEDFKNECEKFIELLLVYQYIPKLQSYALIREIRNLHYIKYYDIDIGDDYFIKDEIKLSIQDHIQMRYYEELDFGTIETPIQDDFTLSNLKDNDWVFDYLTKYAKSDAALLEFGSKDEFDRIMEKRRKIYA